jgi:GTP cyclohydrolase I
MKKMKDKDFWEEAFKFTKSSLTVPASKRKKSSCKNCGTPFFFAPQVEKGDYCSWDCRYEDHSQIIKDSYTPNLRKVKRQLALARWADPAERENLSRKMSGRDVSEETRTRNRNAHKRNPYYVAKEQVIRARGCRCERCGKELKPKWELVIHHIDGCQWNNDPDNLMILCRPCHSRFHQEISSVAGRWAGKAQVANYVARILQLMGIDLAHPDFKETPLRVARCYQEMFGGVGKEKEVEDLLKKWFPTDNDEMVVTRLKSFSLCPHHLLPVEYDMVFGYIPKDRAIGLSKVVRVCELLAKKPILQENLTTEITSLFMKYLKPKGCAVTLTGRHSCMRIRGIHAENSEVVTSDLQGEFRDGEVRAEFFQLARISRT